MRRSDAHRANPIEGPETQGKQQAARYTDYALPPDNPISVKAKAAATDYFKAHPVDLIEATGTDLHSDLTYDLLLALDPKASLLFSFIWNLAD